MQPLPWRWREMGGNPEIGRQPNVNGTFYKQNLVTENQLSASWKGTPAKSCRVGGVQSLSIWEPLQIVRLGGPFGSPLQIVKGWGGSILVHLGAAPNREGPWPVGGRYKS